MNQNELFRHHQLFASLDQAFRVLSPAAAQTLHQLSHLLAFPSDIPRLATVLNVAADSVIAYGATLRSPNATFRLVQAKLDELRHKVVENPGFSVRTSDLEQPLLKRLKPHSPYALCLSMGNLPAEKTTPLMVACGVEIAICLITGRAFALGFADNMRRDLTPRLYGFDEIRNASDVWHKTAKKKIQLAAKLFEEDGSPQPSDTNHQSIFDLQAGFELSRKIRYSPPRQRQALNDSHQQCDWQLNTSASQILTRAQCGDQTALLTMIASVTGLSLATTMSMPIAKAMAHTTSVMTLNTDNWTIETNLGRLTPGAARPSPDATIFRASTWTLVKPLPATAAELLKTFSTKHPNATSLFELLPDALTSGRQQTINGDTSTLKPSTTRFLASIGPLAVGLGIDRLTAAFACNDFAIVPGSKLYYALSARQPVWDAADLLFNKLGWGNPVPFVAGLPCGSHIVPTQEAIAEWAAWMSTELHRLSPGRHCNINRLVAHHNAFAGYCASLAKFLLTAREAKELHFTTSNLSPSASFGSLIDKRVGIFPGALWMPISRPLREQITLWLRHCAALRRRLRKLGLPPDHPLMSMLECFIDGEELPLFFSVDPKALQPKALGSADLAQWWPESHRFSPDFGRHFWETELREAGVSSSRIDLLMRHVTQAVESHCSTHADSLRDVAKEICAVQSNLLTRLGFQAIAGLQSRK